MLWISLRSGEIARYPSAERIERESDKIFCLREDGTVAACFPFDQVLAYTKDPEVAELMRRAFSEGEAGVESFRVERSRDAVGAEQELR
nr:hypothetical protein [uncultured bacterium]